jgi:hypothetical protein
MKNFLKTPLMELNPNNMISYPHIRIIGKRGSGKTTMAIDLIHKLEATYNFAEILVFNSAGYGSDISYHKSAFETSPKIVNNYSDVDILHMMTNFADDKEYLVVFDSFVVNKPSSVLRELLNKSFRHNICVIITQQTPISVSSEFDASVDYVFIMDADMMSTKQKIYDRYVTFCPTFETFDDIVTETTVEHNSLVVVGRKPLTSIGNGFEKRLLTYRADLHLSYGMSLQKMKIDNVEKNPVMLFIGKCYSGEVPGMIEIARELNKKRSYENSLFVSPYERNRTIWSNTYDGNVQVSPTYNCPDILSITSEAKENLNKNYLIVLDDCIHDSQTYAKQINRLLIALVSKLSNVTVLVSSHVLDVQFSSFAKYIFMAKEDSVRSRKRLYNLHRNIYSSFELFNCAFTKTTQDFDMIVLDKKSRRSLRYVSKRTESIDLLTQHIEEHDLRNQSYCPHSTFNYPRVSLKKSHCVLFKPYCHNVMDNTWLIGNFGPEKISMFLTLS